MKDNKKDIKFILPLSLLGGRENIVKVNNCATRLRLEVKDVNKVDAEEIKKYYPAVQKISNTEVHIIVGTNASELAESLERIIAFDDNASNMAMNLIPMLGGIENIVKVNNCATRLRLEVKDMNKVNADEIKKYYPAVQKISSTEVHIVVGTDASLLAEALRKLLESQKVKTVLLLPLLGGIENIVKVDNCATRLRLEVKDMNKVNTKEIMRYYPALEKISDTELHIVVGTDANLLANEFKTFTL